MEEKIKKLLEKEVEKAGFVIDEVTYQKEDGNNVLRIIIDKKGFVNINDCIAVNKIINPILDEKDPISESYVLEVCSKEKGSDQNG